MLIIAYKKHTKDIVAVKIRKKKNEAGIELPIHKMNVLMQILWKKNNK